MRYLWACASSLFLVPPAYAQAICENEIFENSAPCVVESISWVDVELSGSAEEIGIKKSELERLIRLRFRNDLSMIPHEVIRVQDALEEVEYDYASNLLKGRGLVTCMIWTVGTQYPIAYNIECFLGSFNGFIDDYFNPRAEYLGYAGLEGIDSVMDETIRDAVADMSSQFIEMKGNSIISN